MIRRLIRLPSLERTRVNAPQNGIESSAFASNLAGRGGQGRGRGRGGGRSGGCPQCTYGKRFDHIEDKCYSLIGFLEKPINTTQSNDSGKDFELRSINRNVVSDDEYEAYL